MTDNELLLAISNLLDEKLQAELQPIKDDLKAVKDEQNRINLIIENEIRSDIKLLAENYVPAAKRYEKEAESVEAIKTDIHLLKKVVAEHSQKLQALG